jgi:glycogen(starch) synthase
VLREVPRARFVFIGADRPHCPGGRTHVRFVEEEFPGHVRERIRFTGRLPTEEVDRQLQGADLFVAPSLYESFGLIFLEAMRWGTPVIGTRAGGIPEVVEDGKSGLLVPPNDARALTSALVILLQNADLRRRIGEAGRSRVESMFSDRIMAARVASLYGRAVRPKKPFSGTIDRGGDDRVGSPSDPFRSVNTWKQTSIGSFGLSWNPRGSSSHPWNFTRQ